MNPSRRRLAVLVPLLFLVAALAACSPTGSSSPSLPTASPTSIIVPPATGLPGSTPPASVAPSSTPVAAAWPLTLVDDEGTTVSLPAEPQKIVSLSPATTEILFAVGAGSRVVATTSFDDYPPQAVGLPHVATYQGVDVEKIVGLGADLVVAGGNGFNPPDAIAKLRSLGIPVLVVYAPNVAGVLKDVSLVAAAAGEPAAGSALAASMRSGIDGIAKAVAADSKGPKPRVFYELDATKDIYGPADNSFVTEMISLAGGDPITTGSPTVFSISLEKLVAADPQIIVLGDSNYGVTADQVKARPGWEGMTAVRSGAIRGVDDTLVTRPGPRLVAGLFALARAIEPAVPLPVPPVASQAP